MKRMDPFMGQSDSRHLMPDYISNAFRQVFSHRILVSIQRRFFASITLGHNSGRVTVGNGRFDIYPRSMKNAAQVSFVLRLTMKMADDSP